MVLLIDRSETIFTAEDPGAVVGNGTLLYFVPKGLHPEKRLLDSISSFI
jgi:hypothetical protein